jgi:hypothetical protein
LFLLDVHYKNTPIYFTDDIVASCGLAQNAKGWSGFSLSKSKEVNTMAKLFSDMVRIKNSSDEITIALNANLNVTDLGAPGNPAALVVRDEAGGEVLRLDGTLANLLLASGAGTAANATLIVRDSTGCEVFRFTATPALLQVGAEGNGGQLSVRDASDRETLRFDSSSAGLILGTKDSDGDLVIRDYSDQVSFHLDGGSATMRVGAIENAGDIHVVDNVGSSSISLGGANALVQVGATGNNGHLSVRDSSNREVLQFDAQFAVMRIGAEGNEGDLIVRDGAGREVFHVDGNSGLVRIGTAGNEGDISVRDARDREVLQFDAEFAVLRVGAAGNEGDIIVRNDAGAEVIHMNGGTGDIILSNGDAAEQFDLADAALAEPGMVMVLNADGRLEPASSAYDKKVVGVVAGAGNFRPGIVLDHKEATHPRVPISVLGKVSCKVDSSFGAVEVGDLLTTSPTPGYAMKVSDPLQAFGSVIGKALSPLAQGTGHVDVLVTLK